MARKTTRGGEVDDELYTPLWLLQWFDDFGQFDLDPCWSPFSWSEPRVTFDIHQDGFKTSWAGFRSAWVNFPYSGTGAWIEKCWRESDNMLVVGLMPAKPGETAWRKYVWGGQAKAVSFLPGRIQFDRPPGFNSTPGTFNSSLVFWGPDDSVARAVNSVRRLSKGHKHEPTWVQEI